MSPPLDKSDEERLLRLFSRMLDDRLKPRDERADKLSGKFGQIREEVSPAVARKLSESQHDIEDRARGFERTVLDALREHGRKLEEIETGLQPRAMVRLSDGQGGTSERPASMVAAESSVRTENAAYKLEGKADAIQVAANRSDTQSLAAARWAKLGPVITIATTAMLAGLWKFIEYLLHL